MTRAILTMIALASLSSCGGKEREEEVRERVGERMRTELAGTGLELGSPVFIRAFKEEKELELFVRGKETGKFALLPEILHRRGQRRAGPEARGGRWPGARGVLLVPPAAMNPNSSYHLSFNIGFPNAYDKALGRTGSFIMIHGSNVSIGCLAMTDEEFEEIYTICQAAHEGGQDYFRVHIFPFRMTEASAWQKPPGTNGSPSGRT